ncbi:unnamed protein product [Linum tenue]|uniref:Uncharacterized protein n=1 Tax=Linum tenue TaxID=586396 RepID=A0AAV0PXT0_9ROSI|nr:unnamed protein product [Linum tenue]
MDLNRVDEVSVGSVDAQELLQIATSSDNATEVRYQLETSISTNSGNNEQEEDGTTSTSPSQSAAASATNDKYANVKGFKARKDP